MKDNMTHLFFRPCPYFRVMPCVWGYNQLLISDLGVTGLTSTPKLCLISSTSSV